MSACKRLVGACKTSPQAKVRKRFHGSVKFRRAKAGQRACNMVHALPRGRTDRLTRGPAAALEMDHAIMDAFMMLIHGRW